MKYTQGVYLSFNSFLCYVCNSNIKKVSCSKYLCMIIQYLSFYKHYLQLAILRSRQLTDREMRFRELDHYFSQNVIALRSSSDGNTQTLPIPKPGRGALKSCCMNTEGENTLSSKIGEMIISLETALISFVSHHPSQNHT